MAKGLTPKQKRFCQQYVIDLNGTQAAIRAGYSEKTANEQGARLLANVSISAYIKQLQDKIGQKLEITAEKVVQELAKIGFSNIQSFIEEQNSTTDISKVEPEKAAAVSSIKVITTVTGTGRDRQVKEAVEFKLHDKVSALEKLGRHLGIFEKDNAQIAPPKPQTYKLPNGAVISFE